MILKYPTEKEKPIPPELIKKAKIIEKITPEIEKIAKKMVKAMEKYNGAGLAANQIGELKRIICYVDDGKSKALINPEIVKKSIQKVEVEEGCLSSPNLFAKVIRPAKVKVKGKNQFGKKQNIKAENMLAVVLQHEIDHLDGILFIHKAVPGTLHKIKPKKAVQAVELKNGKS